MSGAVANIAMTLGIVIGAAIGGYLGLMTERGLPGLITAVGVVGGAGIGLYVAQAILSGQRDESD